MSDKAYQVIWSAGKIIVHAIDENSAIDVALKYLRVREAKRITASPFLSDEASPASSEPQ